MKKTVLFILGILIFVYCLFRFDVFSSLVLLKDVPIISLIILILVMNYVLFLRAYRWQYLANSLSAAKLSFADAFRIVCCAWFISFATPAKIGEVSKIYFMKKIDKKKVFALTVIEYLMDALSLFTLPLIFSIIYLYQIKYFIGALVLLLVGIIGIYIVVSEKWTNRLFGYLVKNGKDIIKIKNEIIKNIRKDIKHGKVMLNGLLLSHLNYIIFYLIAFYVFKIVGIDISIWVLLAGFSIGHLVGAISFIPVGLGIRELGSTAFFVLQGFPAEQVFYPLVVIRIITFVPFLVSFFVYLKFVKKTS